MFSVAFACFLFNCVVCYLVLVVQNSSSHASVITTSLMIWNAFDALQSFPLVFQLCILIGSISWTYLNWISEVWFNHKYVFLECNSVLSVDWPMGHLLRKPWKWKALIRGSPCFKANRDGYKKNIFLKEKTRQYMDELRVLVYAIWLL